MLEKFFSKIEKITPEKWRWILNHEGFKRYFSNTGWMFFGQAFNLILSFFIGVWIIRYLGPENYGILSYALAFTGIFFFVSTLGIDRVLKRELINFPEKRDQLLGTSFRLKIIGGSLAIALSIFSIFLLDSSPLVRGLVFLCSLTFVLQSFNIIDVFFQVRVEAKKGVIAQVIASSISSVLKIAIIFSGAGIIWLMLVYVLDYVWSGIFLLFFYRRTGFKIRFWKFDLSLAKKMFSDSWPLMFTSFSVFIYMKIDQVMIKEMINEVAVGLYSAPVRILDLFYFIPSIICLSLFPAVLNARKVDLKVYRSRLKKLMIFLIILSLIVILPISIFSKYIINFLFGTEYLSSSIILGIGVWSLLGVSLRFLVGQYLVAEGYFKIYFYITLMGAVINIVLNIFLIPIWGITGAIVVTVFSYSLVPIFSLFFRKVRRDFFRFKSV